MGVCKGWDNVVRKFNLQKFLEGIILYAKKDKKIMRDTIFIADELIVVLWP